MVFNTSLTKEQVQEKLSHLRKLKYNQFRWWRMYEDPRKPLPNRSPFKDRILNGEFDFSHYWYQAMLCEHEINDIYLKYQDDQGRYVEESSLWRTRRKRLLEDFEKDEANRLNSLIKEFPIYFRCTKEQVEKEMEEFGGSILDFYFYIEEKYKPYNIPQSIKRRGRPKK